jgi:hypothetical protein
VVHLAGDGVHCIATTRDAMARKLFLASILYLPLVLGALVADRLLAHERPGHPGPQRCAQRTRHAPDDGGFWFIRRALGTSDPAAKAAAIVLAPRRDAERGRGVGGVSRRLRDAQDSRPRRAHALRRRGAIATVYYVMLVTHIVLAITIAWLVPRTFLFALTGHFVRHRKWARWTFPIWYYVSITGVLVYFFLYQWWPAAAKAAGG